MGSYLSSAVGVVGASLLAILCGAGTALAQKTWSVGTAPKMSPEAIYVGNTGSNVPPLGIPMPVNVSTIILYERQKVPLRVHAVDVDNYTEVLSGLVVPNTDNDTTRVLWTASMKDVLSTGNMGQTKSDEAVILTAPLLLGQKSALLKISVMVDDIWKGAENGRPKTDAGTRNDDETKQPTVSLSVIIVPETQLKISQLNACDATFATIYNGLKDKPNTAGFSDYTMKVSGGAPPINWNGLFVTEVTEPNMVDLGVFDSGTATDDDFVPIPQQPRDYWKLKIPLGSGFVVGFPPATNPAFGCKRPGTTDVFYDTYLTWAPPTAQKRVVNKRVYNFSASCGEVDRKDPNDTTGVHSFGKGKSRELRNLQIPAPLRGTGTRLGQRQRQH